ncbi:MAG: FAD-dependent tricarballylate dehydrogenase TcuA [Acidimicrobiia bacterium]
MLPESTDVVVVGCGNAALCAALSAKETGAKVVVLEIAPEEESGGNSAFTAGAMRVVYESRDHLLELIPDLSEDELARTDFGTYTANDFIDDMARVTEYRTDPDLVEILVRRSHETLLWMTQHAVRFAPIYGRQAFQVKGKFTFWGGLTIETVAGGPGLVQSLKDECARMGIPIHYESRATRLLTVDSGVSGVVVETRSAQRVIQAGAVVLASGGFEANPEWRTRYLGPGWDLAKVRGGRFNIGDGIRMALEIGASPAGHWSGCHAVQWDRNAPEFGDLAVGDGFQKHSYPFGILVNEEGKRFLDEGADFRNYTYAKYGHVVLAQPHQVAWQVFDAKTAHLLRDEYKIRQVTKFSSDTLEALAARLEGIDQEQFFRTVAEYNAGVAIDTEFNPNVRDGRGTTGVTPPKTNWANTIDTPPFEAYQVTCGITFTFGGLRIVPDTGAVMSVTGRPIGNLFACGELVGGLFYFNYPGGTGLTSGSVFGKIAGASAATAALRQQQLG